MDWPAAQEGLRTSLENSPDLEAFRPLFETKPVLPALRQILGHAVYFPVRVAISVKLSRSSCPTPPRTNLRHQRMRRVVGRVEPSIVAMLTLPNGAWESQSHAGGSCGSRRAAGGPGLILLCKLPLDVGLATRYLAQRIQADFKRVQPPR